MPFFEKYLDDMGASLKRADTQALEQLALLLRATHDRGRKTIVVGNGGSAAIAAHVAVDLTKAAGVRAVTFNEADLLTCFANDFGYEHWVEKALDFYSDAGDVVILISSSGTSPNIVNGAKRAADLKLQLVTFSGFEAVNPLRPLGALNFWVDSKSYNVVEMTHHVWLVAVVDRLAGAT